MSRFSDAERARIIAATAATLARGQAAIEQQQQHEAEYLGDMQQPEDDADALVRSAPVEDRVAVWKAEADQRQREVARERRRRQRAEQLPAQVDVNMLVASAIAEERLFMTQVIGEAFAEMLERQREAIESALQPLRVELAQLKAEAAEQRAVNAELRIALAGDGNKGIVDLPALPLRGRAN